MSNNENFYTTKEIAEILDVPLTTVYYWRTEENLEKGMLPEPVRKGRTLLWNKTEFHDWLSSRNLEELVEEGTSEKIINVLSAVNGLVQAVVNNGDLESPLSEIKAATNVALENL